MEHLVSEMNRSQGSKHHGEKLMDEMKELGKLRTAVMVEKCQIENKKVMCPKPRKCGRLNRDNNELRVSKDISDIILCKILAGFTTILCWFSTNSNKKPSYS
ncbi:uncharacterized protein [Typha angustifolia]|uniref:uncharacterized protein isoform X2 n=1 Tax=Typha angustifolia TaxID=59011 RepID=UPI003C30D443